MNNIFLSDIEFTLKSLVKNYHFRVNCRFCRFFNLMNIKKFSNTVLSQKRGYFGAD